MPVVQEHVKMEAVAAILLQDTDALVCLVINISIND